jgi:uncharacterized protein with HEPN domain
MSDAAPREWRFCIDDMVDIAEKVVLYTAGLDQEALVGHLRAAFDARR